VETTYGFPRTDPGAALAAADELSRRHTGGSLRRVETDGGISFVGRTEWFFGARFHLYRIDTDGRAYLEEDTPAPPAFRFWVLTMLAGAAGCVASALSVLGSGRDGDITWFFVSFAVGLIGIVRANHFGVQWYVRELFGSDEGWHRLYVPLTWMPETGAQLHRVESLADEHGGEAYVRPLEDGTAEVATTRRGHVEHFRVSQDGTVVQLRRAMFLGPVVGAGFVLGGFVAMLAVQGRFDLPPAVMFAMFMGFVLTAGVVAQRCSLKYRLEKQLPGEWHLVRTKPEDND